MNNPQSLHWELFTLNTACSADMEFINTIFGVLRERLETILRTLKEDKNRVLNADLNMGLDNINLREDLSSMIYLKCYYKNCL
jgi:hypothetical protein